MMAEYDPNRGLTPALVEKKLAREAEYKAEIRSRSEPTVVVNVRGGDPADAVIYAINPAADGVLDYAPVDGSGENIFYEGIHGKDIPGVMQFLDAAKKSRHKSAVEYRLAIDGKRQRNIRAIGYHPRVRFTGGFFLEKDGIYWGKDLGNIVEMTLQDITAEKAQTWAQMHIESAPDLDTLFAKVESLTKKITGASRVTLVCMDPDDPNYVAANITSRGKTVLNPPLMPTGTHISAVPSLDYMAGSHQSFIIESASNPATPFPWLVYGNKEPDWKSHIGYPISKDQSSLPDLYLFLSHPKEGHFIPGDIDALHVITPSIGMAYDSIAHAGPVLNAIAAEQDIYSFAG